MLGRRNAQRSLLSAAAQLGHDAVDGLGFYAVLARRGGELFKDEDFTSAYCDNNGRPSTPRLFLRSPGSCSTSTACPTTR